MYNRWGGSVLTNMGIMYRRNGQVKKAIKFFEQAIKVNPKYEYSRLNKGIVLLHDLNDKEKAIKVWEELLEINPLFMVSKSQSLDEMITHYKKHKKI